MRPNIVLITADDMNYNTPGFMGGGVEGITPNLDNLAAEGIYFERAHVTVAMCNPSRTALMTGRYPHRTQNGGIGPIHGDIPTLQEHLGQAGYFQGIIGKESHLKPKEKFNWDVYIRTMGEESGLGRDPQVYYEQSKVFFDQAKEEGKPFFLMANSHDPHRPFAGSNQELKKFSKHTPASRVYQPEEVEVPGFLPDLPDVREELAQYYTSCHRCDEAFGGVLRALHESGLEDHTMVVFTIDHGMSFPYSKTNCYLNSTKTPWIVKWPGKVKPGQVDTDHFISCVDFAPTVLEAAGLPPMKDTDGSSFLTLLQGEGQSGRGSVHTQFNTKVGGLEYPMRCIHNGRYGYIYNIWVGQEKQFKSESMSGLTFPAMQQAAKTNEDLAERIQFLLNRTTEELYDFERDPDALHNLIDHPHYQEKAEELRNELLQVMISSDDPWVETFKQEALR